MSELPHGGGSSKFDGADFAVGAVCSLFAYPICEAGWHAIVVEHDAMTRGLIGLAIGVPIGLTGLSFHWWKNKIPAIRDWFLPQAKRWWLAALLLAFVYVAGPEIYQRATKPIAVTGAIGTMPIGTSSLEEATSQATKKIANERDEAALSGARMAKERDDALQALDNLRRQFASQAAAASTALTPEQQQLQALLKTNANLPSGDRQRLADAFFEFSKFLDGSNELFGAANLALAGFERDVRGAATTGQVDEEKQKLQQIVKETQQFKKDFDSVRAKWRFYQQQLDYVFGREPDNNALKLQNGMAHISNFLEGWSQIENKQNESIYQLLWYPKVQSEKYLMGFSEWKRGCQQRLQQMRDSL